MKELKGEKTEVQSCPGSENLPAQRQRRRNTLWRHLKSDYSGNSSHHLVHQEQFAHLLYERLVSQHYSRRKSVIKWMSFSFCLCFVAVKIHGFD